jgi:hypothetical protein
MSEQNVTAVAVKTPAWMAEVQSGRYEEAMKVATLIAASGLVPNCYRGKPADILIASAMGMRLGLGMMESLAGIQPINGRAMIWGDLMLAVCQSNQGWGGMTTTWDSEKNECTVKVTRSGHDYFGHFSVEESKTAGLWDERKEIKNSSGAPMPNPTPWHRFPLRMVEMRARAYALRAGFADVLAGIACREEYEGQTFDVTDPESPVVVKPHIRSRPARNVASAFTDAPAAPAAEPEAPAVDPAPAQEEPKAEVPEVPAPVVESFTTQDLVEACRAAVTRLGGGRRVLAALREITGDAGLKKADEVKPEHLAKCMDAVKALKPMVG